MVQSGISDKVEMFKETVFGDGGTSPIEFGFINKLTWNADPHTSSGYSTDGSSEAVVLYDGVLAFNGTIHYNPTDGRELESIIGTLTDDTVSSFTIDTANILPSYAALAELGDGTILKLSGIKFGKTVIKISKGAVIDISSDLIIQKIEESTDTLTPQTPVTKPFIDLDSYFSIKSGVNLDLNDFTLNIDRGTIGRRGIEKVTAVGEKRLITNVIEHNQVLTASGTAVADKFILEATFGGASITDYRTEDTMVLSISNNSNTLSLTMSALLTVTSKDTGATDELMTLNFDVLARNISIAGTY